MLSEARPTRPISQSLAHPVTGEWLAPLTHPLGAIQISPSQKLPAAPQPRFLASQFEGMLPFPFASSCPTSCPWVESQPLMLHGEPRDFGVDSNACDLERQPASGPGPPSHLCDSSTMCILSHRCRFNPNQDISLRIFVTILASTPTLFFFFSYCQNCAR